MFDELRRIAMFTSGVAELTRNQAERLVKDMVEKGDVRRRQASDTVRELVSTSKQSREMLIEFVRGEIRNQVSQLGLANKRDLERLERRIARLEGRSGAKKAGARRTSGDEPAHGGAEKKKPTARKTTRSAPPKKVSPSGATRTASPSAPPIARTPAEGESGDTTGSGPGSS
jgi:polyhydroxyalkanoate synthesis regulator phasin